MSAANSPRSLTFPHSSTVSNQRNSGSQLPLPPTLTGGLSSPTQKRLSDGLAQPSPPASPSSPSFAIRPRSPVSRVRSPEGQLQGSMRSSHASGIQPSANFFKPSRPQANYSRPSSRASMADEADGFPMSAMNKRHSLASSDDHAGMPDTTIDEQPNFSSLRGMKQSKEGLLPIGEQPSQHERHTSTNSIPDSKGAGRLMRSSVDMMVNIGRGLSFDSSHRSMGSPHAYTSGGNGKLVDEEQGVMSRHKESSEYANRLNITSTRHSRNPTPSPSLDPSFTPAPPRHQVPPYYAVPRIDPKRQKPMRNYQLHPSRNKFFLGGRVLTGGDSPWAFISSFTIALGITGAWFGTTCVWWWHNESIVVAIVGAYLALIVISSMLKTAFTDPGILPRNLDENPPYPSTSPSDGGIRAPMPRDLKVRADVVRVKYCPTCKIYRPPRSSHCKMCDNCVDGCDHHCQWVNNCVGRRNYASFFILLVSAVLTLILVIVTSALHLYWLTSRENLGFKHALSQGAGSAVAFSMSVVVIWPISALLSYHLRLLLLNVTTIEQIRNQAHKSLMPGPAPPNPFSHGSWRKNFVAVLCRPTGYSWIDPHGVATEDKREVNPGVQTEIDHWDGRHD